MLWERVREMSARPRGVTSITRNRKIAGALLAAAVAAGTAYAVPSTARGSTAVGGRPGPPPLDQAGGSRGGHGTVEPRRASGAQLTPLETGAGSLLRTPDGERYVVDIRLSSYKAATVTAIKAAGGRLMIASPESDRVTMSVLPQDLTAVGDVAGVEYVAEEYTPQFSACDTTHSEGDAILHADQLRATGVDGTGVKVGVMSDSYNKFAGAFTTAPADIVSDNLPGAANTCGHTTVSTVADKPTAGTDEGRGMMQIVHDLAPGSPLDFATAFINEPSFASNITALANQGAKVIVDDVTYFDEPMYQDGIVEQAITGVRAQGVNYFSSSANNRMVLNNHEVGSYEAVGGYRPTTCPAIAAITGTHADCHNFGTVGAPDSTFTYLPNNGQTIRAIMNWAEPWAAVQHRPGPLPHRPDRQRVPGQLEHRQHRRGQPDDVRGPRAAPRPTPAVTSGPSSWPASRSPLRPRRRASRSSSPTTASSPSAPWRGRCRPLAPATSWARRRSATTAAPTSCRSGRPTSGWRRT